VLRHVADGLEGVELEHFGSKEFLASPLHGLVGIGSVTSRTRTAMALASLRASSARNFASTCRDSTGSRTRSTTDHRREAFPGLLQRIVADLRSTFADVWVLRNERQVGIYDFDNRSEVRARFLTLPTSREGQGLRAVPGVR